eukprot:362204-Chlamydomonas_euryale.AAC.4
MPARDACATALAYQLTPFGGSPPQLRTCSITPARHACASSSAAAYSASVAAHGAPGAHLSGGNVFVVRNADSLAERAMRLAYSSSSTLTSAARLTCARFQNPARRLAGGWPRGQMTVLHRRRASSCWCYFQQDPSESKLQVRV